MGGIAGNLIDRIVFGYVRDFMDIRLFKYYFPIFNISDALVVMGTILLIISVIKGDDIGENKSSKRLYKSNKNR